MSTPLESEYVNIIERLLAPFAPLARVQPRRTDDAELLLFAGLSVHGLRRVLAGGELEAEQAPGGRYFVTLEAVARWRASRYSPENETAAGETAASKGTSDAKCNAAS